MVSDANQLPIGVATIEVAVVGATTPAARGSANPDGAFRIRGLRPGRYRVLVRALGYTPRELSSVEVASPSLSVDVGTVMLTAAALELQSVSVTAQREAVQLAPDRNTYVARDMATTKGGTVLDVLRNIPSVDVDIDNVVSLRGNSGVIVQINGRPSPLKASQLGDFLAQLPADMVNKIEVIPNPSAREDADGAAGIINIVLKQEAEAGGSGGITVAGGTTGSMSIGGNAGYQRGPLTAFASYTFLKDNRPRDETLFRENTYLDPVTYLDERARRSRAPQSNTLTGSATYKLGKHDEISADVLYTTRTRLEKYGILYSDLDASQNLVDMSDRLTTTTENQRTFDAALAYKHAFAGAGHRLSGELRFNTEEEGGPSNAIAHNLALDGTAASVTDLENQLGWDRPTEESVKIDYVRPLSSVVRLETGYKGSLQHFHTTLNTNVFDTTLAAYQPDSTRISTFTYDEVVNAAYGMLVAQPGKFVLQAGVRLEHATTNFDLRTLDSTYKNAYNSVFPSALVAYNFDDDHQLKPSYSTRIRRLR